jgi:hypothetical protein
MIDEMFPALGAKRILVREAGGESKHRGRERKLTRMKGGLSRGEERKVSISPISTAPPPPSTAPPALEGRKRVRRHTTAYREAFGDSQEDPGAGIKRGKVGGLLSRSPTILSRTPNRKCPGLQSSLLINRKFHFTI